VTSGKSACPVARYRTIICIAMTVRDEAHGAFERCRRRFPSVELDLESFLARIDQVLPPTDDTGTGALQYEDLFLATACARGDRIAWEHFANQYLAAIKGFAVKACGSLHEAEELSQQIVAVLIEDKAKIGSYNGRGSLAGWLRVAVAHAAIDRFRRSSRTVSLDEMQESGAAFQAPEDERSGAGTSDSRWGRVLCALLSEQLRQLSPRDRLLLALYYVRSVSLKAIGRHFGVHESTVSRWLESLRRNLRKGVEHELRTRHGLRGREIQALWIWASEVESFSLDKVLGGAQEILSSDP
jgi:RNA polymerase sigma-70 factor, ECF subfamily